MIKKIEKVCEKLITLRSNFKDDGIKEVITSRKDYYLTLSKNNLNNDNILNNNYKKLQELYEVSERQLPIQNTYYKEDSIINKIN